MVGKTLGGLPGPREGDLRFGSGMKKRSGLRQHGQAIRPFGNPNLFEFSGRSGTRYLSPPGKQAEWDKEIGIGVPRRRSMAVRTNPFFRWGTGR